ncbi:MAG: DUF1926 domain-containing protein [Planctomycetaceae bacterium]|nr:MAG: DUF1926 domain-containing protein [Planctomycetaceae bacterium]
MARPAFGPQASRSAVLPNSADAMTPSVHLCLVFHNHQPVGGFENELEEAYRRCYLPFLDLFEPFETVAISLHTGGHLLAWLAEQHPEYVDRLRSLVEAGRIEILGGPQFEPILPMIPPRDRIGQVLAYADWLRRHLGQGISGIWTPESVWESSLIADLVAAGAAYTVLHDDTFLNAGLTDDELNGHFLTEDQGAVLRVFPSSRRLRSLVRVAPVRRLIDHCWHVAQTQPGATLTLATAGEVFGSRPDAQGRDHQDGWLKAFFEALQENHAWLHTTTLADSIRRTPARGTVYLGDGGPAEWNRAALPPKIERECLTATTKAGASASNDDAEAENDRRPFLRAGQWRNFRVKYEEANDLYSRMLYVSRRLQSAADAGADRGLLATAREHLYRGQSHPPYWHGTKAGIHLPQLRQAACHHLIRADAILDEALAGVGADEAYPVGAAFAEASVDDFNFDLMQEVRLANDHGALWIAPGRGGRIYRWDLRELGHNLLATFRRHREAYHPSQDDPTSILANQPTANREPAGDNTASSDRPPTHDRLPRHSLTDHFYDEDVSLNKIIDGTAFERGDFVDTPFRARLFRSSDRVQLRMRREGHAWGLPVSITKAVTLQAGSDQVTVTYLLENLQPQRTFHFGVEFNIAGPTTGPADGWLLDAGGQRLGHVGERLSQANFSSMQLQDRYHGLNLRLSADRPGSLWAYPVTTLSRDGQGLRPIHQGVCLIPHWLVQGDEAGRWAMRLTWRISGPAGESGQQPSACQLQTAVA